MLGALHISLNAQENVVHMYLQLMKYFGEKVSPNGKLADKPVPWRGTMLIEVLYSGWTSFRSGVIDIFQIAGIMSMELY